MGHMPQAASLFASATRTTAVANEAGTAVANIANARRVICLLDVTAMAGAAGDVLDVYVDVSPDEGSTWLNAVHFTQVAGNGAAQKKIAILDPSSPGTSEVNVTSDAASGAVRPAAWGAQIRGRYTLVDAGGHGQSATFSLKALMQ
jgi:hypothetical protein